ncbi:hypothetical protein ASG48_04310 [Aurantimonas sp. Leaf443]|nr:hypothetical protein ASG48_04310 [Aurantimonas sp. Leaf443]
MIDATAERLSSRPIVTTARARPTERILSPVYEVPPPAVPAAPAAPAPTANFGRRMAPPVDLVFQPQGVQQLRRLVPRRRSPLAALAELARGAPLARRALFACGFLIGLLSVPALLLTMLGAPVAATLAAPDISATLVGGIAVENATSAITTRGAGAVLTVSGTLRNALQTPSLVPTMRIALTDEAGRTLQRPFRPTRDRLAAGETLAFSTRIAVPAELAGAVSIKLVPQETSL